MHKRVRTYTKITPDRTERPVTLVNRSEVVEASLNKDSLRLLRMPRGGNPSGCQPSGNPETVVQPSEPEAVVQPPEPETAVLIRNHKKKHLNPAGEVLCKALFLKKYQASAVVGTTETKERFSFLRRKTTVPLMRAYRV